MSPTLISHDSAYVGNGYPEFIRENTKRHNATNVSRSNGANLLFGKFRTACSPTVRCPTFPHHIIVVIFFAAKKQVRRVDAGRIVASMKYARLFGDRAKVNLPRKTVRHIGDIRSRDRSVGPKPTMANFRADDYPVLIDAIPEPNKKWYVVSSQDRNLHRQVSFWSGPLENANSLVGRFVF
jgi:hypothetical protein